MSTVSRVPRSARVAWPPMMSVAPRRPRVVSPRAARPPGSHTRHRPASPRVVVSPRTPRRGSHTRHPAQPQQPHGARPVCVCVCARARARVRVWAGGCAAAGEQGGDGGRPRAGEARGLGQGGGQGGGGRGTGGGVRTSRREACAWRLCSNPSRSNLANPSRSRLAKPSRSASLICRLVWLLDSGWSAAGPSVREGLSSRQASR